MGTRKIGIKTRTDASVVVVEAAILLEAGWYQDMGEVPALFAASFPDLGDRVLSGNSNPENEGQRVH